MSEQEDQPQQNLSSYGVGYRPSKPVLPDAGSVLHLSGNTMRQLSSKERAQERIDTAAGIPVAEAEIDRLEALTEKVRAQAAALAKQLPKLKPEAVLERVEIENKCIALNAELATLAGRAGAGRQQIMMMKAAIEDNLLAWAKARLAYVEKVMPILEAARAEAEGILAMAARELKTGRVDPSRKSLKQINAEIGRQARR